MSAVTPIAVTKTNPATELLRSLVSFLYSYSAILLPAALLLLSICAINWDLFAIPLVESGDVAANAIQVQNAKHFHELLGNYSRWHFHHPGPFFFYMYAAGEALFYDLLHIVPAPLNAEYLTEILFSVSCLCATIFVFDRHSKGRIFPPLAVLAGIEFLYVINTTTPSSAGVSLWMPYASVFCFLLLVTVSASVASGNWGHIPLLIFSAMVMVHSHVAQALFAGVLSSSSLVIAGVRAVKAHRLRQTIRLHRIRLCIAAAILLIFLAPIVPESIVDTPNNISQIMGYLKQHHGEHNSGSVVLTYFTSFLTFYGTPESLFADAEWDVHDLFRSDLYIRIYWALYVAAALLAGGLTIARRQRPSAFLIIGACYGLLVSLLFLYWSWSITGAMYQFNGFFFYSMHLASLLAFSLLISDTLDLAVGRRDVTVIACACVGLALFAAPTVRNAVAGDRDVLPIVNAARAAGVKQVMLTLKERRNLFLAAAGVASYLDRYAIDFCVQSEWEYVFGAAAVCKGTPPYRIDFSDTYASWPRPSNALYRSKELTAWLIPQPALLSIPARIYVNDPMHEMRRFNDTEGTSIWSKRESEIHFSLATPVKDLAPYSLEILGWAIPGRPVEVLFNGAGLGKIDQYGLISSAFKLRSDEIHWGGENVLKFVVPAAGPVGADPRELGYAFEELTLKGGGGILPPNVTEVPEGASGPLITGLTWTPTGYWQPNGQYSEIGTLSQGMVWGSWSGNDTLTGKLRSSGFPSGGGCLIIPAGHGPSTKNLRLAISTGGDETLAEIPLDQTDGKWRFYKVRFDDSVPVVHVVAEDNGTGYGQWLAVGQPRSCGSDR